jgi:diguanylate cyclase
MSGISAPAQLAKGALRRLAQAQQEPTPENFARAYAEESGQPVAAEPRVSGAPWAALIDRLVRGLDRSSRQWTPARKKESLQRVLSGSGSDAQRLQQRLQSLMQAWESGADPDAPVETGETAPATAASAANAAAAPAADSVAVPAAAATSSESVPMMTARDGAGWTAVTGALQDTVLGALPPGEPRSRELADELAALARRLELDGPESATVQAVADVCERARRLLGHRHRLFDDVGRLCHELSAGLTDLSEDESWAQGQCELLQSELADGFSARSVRAATTLLAETRARQQQVRGERAAASRALKDLIQRLLGEVGVLGDQAGRFGESVGRHADAIAQADTLEGLADVVRALVEESHAVQTLVRGTQQSLQRDHALAGELEARVRELEGELRRLSEEVSTDALTQVANRRGLQQAFETESARADRDSAVLAVGLIDIDNFKKLNDSLGHAAGDVALKSLAAAVRDRLRPMDTVARFGGEEFVVLLPGMPADEAQQVLTRLQRALSASLFMHDGHEVLVTFSAGVTAWRPGETLEAALERADEALYEAKRTGKNRTCAA